MLDCIAFRESERQGCRDSHCGSTQRQRLHAALTLAARSPHIHISAILSAFPVPQPGALSLRIRRRGYRTGAASTTAMLYYFVSLKQGRRKDFFQGGTRRFSKTYPGPGKSVEICFFTTRKYPLTIVGFFGLNKIGSNTHINSKQQ